MLRETTFRIGGGLTIGLGLSLAGGLAWSGAGVEFLTAYLAAGLAVGFGIFFVYVGAAEAGARRAFLTEAHAPAPAPEVEAAPPRR